MALLQNGINQRVIFATFFSGKNCSAYVNELELTRLIVRQPSFSTNKIPQPVSSATLKVADWNEDLNA